MKTQENKQDKLLKSMKRKAHVAECSGECSPKCDFCKDTEKIGKLK